MNKKACTVNGCDLEARARGMCSRHYNSWRYRTGPTTERGRADKGPCGVSDCTKGAYRKGYCYAHYMKDYRYGTPTPQHAPKWIDLRGQRFGTLTVTDVRDGRFWVCRCDCGDTALRDSGNLRRWGEANTCGTPGKHYRSDEPGYVASHDRVRRIHGPASMHVCADCGAPADHWSYDHMDADEMYHEYKEGMFAAYSAKPEHYSPRCVPCHKRYDLDRGDSAMSESG